MQLYQRADTPQEPPRMKVKGKLSADLDRKDTFQSVYTTLDTHKDVSEFSHAIPARNHHVHDSELPHVISANLLRDPGANQADFVANQRAEFEKIKKMDVPISLKIQLLTGSVDEMLGHLNLLKLSNSAIKEKIISHEKMSHYAHFLSSNGSTSAAPAGNSKCGVDNHIMELLLSQNPGSPNSISAITKFLEPALQKKANAEPAPESEVGVDDKNYINFLVNEIRKLEDTIVDFKSTRNRVAVQLDDRRDTIIQLTNYIGEQSIQLEHKMAMIEKLKELYGKSAGNVKGGRRFTNQGSQASTADLLAHQAPTQPKFMTMSQSHVNLNLHQHPIDPNDSFCDKADLQLEPQTAVQPGSGHRKKNSGFFGSLSDRFKNLVG